MAITVTCSGCSKRFRASETAAGKLGRCPSCGATFPIPASNLNAVPTFGVDRPFEDSDFDSPRASMPDTAESFQSNDLSSLYEMPRTDDGPVRSKRKRTDEIPSSRGRYKRIASGLVAVDWFQWTTSLLFSIFLVIYGVSQVGSQDEAALRDGSLALQLALSTLVGSVVFSWLATALLALIDIEAHLASMGR